MNEITARGVIGKLRQRQTPNRQELWRGLPKGWLIIP